jgi:4-hydroxy-tetrahydrodipicolinate reductase
MHTILFAGEGEAITLKHEALSKDVFASGALKAAAFLKGKEPGYYTLDDVAAYGEKKG